MSSRTLGRLVGLCALALVLAQIPLAAASTVRGQLYRQQAANTPRYPASGMAVRVVHPQYGASAWVRSGPDGMYYLYNIPPGAFTLEIYLGPNNSLRYSVYVNPQGNTDIAAIRVP